MRFSVPFTWRSLFLLSNTCSDQFCFSVFTTSSPCFLRGRDNNGFVGISLRVSLHTCYAFVTSPLLHTKWCFPELPQFECALSFPLGPCQVPIWPLLSTRSGALAKFSTSLGLSIFICKTARPGSQTQVSGTSKCLKWVRWVRATLTPLLSSYLGHERKQAEGTSQFDLQENPEIQLFCEVTQFQNVGNEVKC